MVLWDWAVVLRKAPQRVIEMSAFAAPEPIVEIEDRVGGPNPARHLENKTAIGAGDGSGGHAWDFSG
jgi:hypothetical protein